jgi:hypothetical protein
VSRVKRFEEYRFVGVRDTMTVYDTDETELLEAFDPAHSSDSVSAVVSSGSSTMPVFTSAEHIGQTTLATSPTWNSKPHSGHLILGT